MSADAGEFDLIARIRSRVASRDDVLLGIGDDAAIVQVPADRQLVVAMDTLNAGVHFPVDTAAADIGWKALAVNLSDLAAMGATPAWCALSLSLPESDATWLDGFLDGFAALAAAHRVALIGGDTTRGPLSICVTVHGLVLADQALRRDAAQVGDDIWVSGTLGDAAAALRQWQGGGVRAAALRTRLDRPTPRVALGQQLAGIAHAAIDISDGLLADLGHVCRASGVGAELRLADLPRSSALAVAFDAAACAGLQASGGDDYELCVTAAPQLREQVLRAAELAETPMACIGRVVAGQGVDIRDASGASWQPTHAGFDHFRAH